MQLNGKNSSPANNIEITAKSINAVNYKIDCPTSIAMELNEYFSFVVPGFKFMPAYKCGMWDGKIRLFDPHKKTLYRGLEDALKIYAKKNGYYLTVENPTVESMSLTEKTLDDIIEAHLPLTIKGVKIKPKDYQAKAVLEMVNNSRTLLVSPTASGKSLVAYLTLRLYTQWKPNLKCLVVVPSVGLIHQLIADFKDYSETDESWDADSSCHLVYQGQMKEDDKPITISTWQSLYQLPKEYFSKYDLVIIDECHLAQANSLKGILEKMENCHYRFGMTGTLTDSKCHRMVLEGLLGPVHTTATTQDLIQKKAIANLAIRCIILKYADEHCKVVKQLPYDQEIKYLIGMKERTDFLCKLASTLKGNTLVLYNYVEKHGIPIFNQLKETISPNQQLFFVSGKIEGDDREAIRQTVAMSNNSIIVASYGTYSTGLSIPNLNNIIFGSPYKSKIRILQSIGRGLRLSTGKTKAVLYDIVDDLQYKGRKNYATRHFEERLKLYIQENFAYELVKINI